MAELFLAIDANLIDKLHDEPAPIAILQMNGNEPSVIAGTN